MNKRQEKPKTKFKTVSPAETSQRRMEVQQEINQHKVVIDRSEFINTQEEKDMIRMAKKYHEYKNVLIRKQ